MKTPVPPFLTVSDEAIQHRGWEVQVRETLVPLPNLLTDWDYQSHIRLVAGIYADGPRILGEASLLASSEIDLVVQVRSSSTKIQRRVFSTPVPLDAANELLCDVELDSNDLGDRLTIQTLLVARNPFASDALGASQPGSILWRSTESTTLEGDASQFPTDTEDFAITRPRFARAGWYLSIDLTDLDAQFVSAVRLSLNSGLKSVQKILAGESDEQTKLVLSALDYDITRQLVQAALSLDEVVGAELDPNSTTLGGVLRILLATLWPRSDPLTLQSQIRDRPADIEVAIQSARRFPS